MCSYASGRGDLPFSLRHEFGEAFQDVGVPELPGALPVGSSPAVGTGVPEDPLIAGLDPLILIEDVDLSYVLPSTEEFTLKGERLGNAVDATFAELPGGSSHNRVMRST